MFVLLKGYKYSNFVHTDFKNKLLHIDENAPFSLSWLNEKDLVLNYYNSNKKIELTFESEYSATAAFVEITDAIMINQNKNIVKFVHEN